MNNPFYNAMQRPNPMQMLTQFRKDPLGALRQAGYNLPSNVQSPQAMIQYMMNSGQITQAQLNNAQAMAQRMGAKF